MKKATSESGTVHLFSDAAVMRHTGAGSVGGDAQSLCGTFHHDGPFTGVNDPLDDLVACENCLKSATNK